ncbi:16S rRNA (cytosine(1402)-N(4))-methyltransferase [Candidatus Giovannonibacteria bacterium RIFCSPLOWO2_01_FULL_44_40]|uniref:Ribosomal RNA small subunit methyltransferase H n=1 Tax=Candidatus Giovannonibacteria bacterium RIFCSPHIGHO2_01_FULL_45_23 TaxID=1798325 RepID=A0A1F5VIL4_9BACT|nr:MAG: 16S rRNA (cytosine(1402)-N(4))-methyltransferase [Candidatus Giovannonibacteria bacterium RIFCSPHIGHO2_01_FULL_45_23]OGF75796.1 MAG: 16S rRNA (cytosine(1402)-N(4))-methyltransferase [Candidatus Giovannonibacteria bacterium RIFCSPHIGHO2_02_FULL_45_13]OGF80310.1 MAG: 16S rRNA (cytosine(1402)-N(4))-methyltransferase [Candidatus Giovannonibacteria bacterium RIFCSPLOWO2_01_FULL_44_40]
MSKYRNIEISKFHKPVLLKEIIALLNLKRGDKVIDATLDGGGHAKAILGHIAPGGKALGIEQDAEMIRLAKRRLSRQVAAKPPSLEIAEGNFRDIDTLAAKHGFTEADAIFFDLGLSTWHFKKSGRGFSFQEPSEPILMQLNTRSQENAANILNTYSEKELTRIFKEYGETRRPYEIAKKIVLARKGKRIRSVGDLLEALKIKDKQSLAKIFQALRIAANDELSALEQALEKSFRLLASGGRLAVISYHSLEDRIVKRNFKATEKEAEIITKKPIIASREETLLNPSSRSAKLRVLQKK